MRSPCMDDLVAQGVKALVIACNTASSAVLRDARERYTVGSGIPVVEVIQPAVRSAVRATRNGRVGVIGTAGTIRSRAYDDAFAAASGLELFSTACPRFVEFVEAGVTSGPELFGVAEEYLAPLIAADIDTLVLGCTHYPLMSAAIQYVMGPEVRLVSSADETAADVYRMLVSHGLERVLDRRAHPPIRVHRRRRGRIPRAGRPVPRTRGAARRTLPDRSHSGRIPRDRRSRMTGSATDPSDGRAADQLRPVTIERGWSKQAEGSALVSFGDTRCCAPRPSPTAFRAG